MRSYQLSIFILFIMGSFNLLASPINITSYNIENALLRNYSPLQAVNPNLWNHQYNGDIELVDNVANLTGNASLQAYDVVNYSNGSGTLTDGEVAGPLSTSQLFASDFDIRITLMFDAYYQINTLNILSEVMSVSNNVIPGSITGLSISANNTSSVFNTQATGVAQKDEFVDLANSFLSDAYVNSIVLSNFQGGLNLGLRLFNITEITLDGNQRSISVSEPNSLILFILALASFSVWRLIKKSVFLVKARNNT